MNDIKIVFMKNSDLDIGVLQKYYLCPPDAFCCAFVENYAKVYNTKTIPVEDIVTERSAINLKQFKTQHSSKNN